MKKALLLCAMVIGLALIASTAMAGVPVVTWFYDSFNTYGEPGTWGKNLSTCAPNWFGATPDFNTRGIRVASTTTNDSYVGDDTAGAYDGDDRWLFFQGFAGALVDSHGESKTFGTSSAGNLQVFHVVVRQGPQSLPHPNSYHFTIMMVDMSGNSIACWQMGYVGVKGRLTKNGADVCSLAFLGTGGTPDATWYDLDITYDPSNGDTKFLIDGVQQGTTQVRATGLAVNKLWVEDLIQGGSGWDAAYLDQVAVGTDAIPTVTAPVGGLFITDTTPDVTWTHANPAGTVTQYEVNICDVDDPNDATPIYASGLQTGTATSYTIPATLPANTWLWAFVKEKYATWTGWSSTGNGGFVVTPTAPGVPTVTSPSSTYIGTKPMVAFSGDVHDGFQVKITSGSGGTTEVWNSGEKTSTFSGASCPSMLTVGTNYYSFARVHNAAGWGGWSSGSVFQVTRDGEGRDTRHMNETMGSSDILNYSLAAPNDGFGSKILNEGQSTMLQVHMMKNCGNAELVIRKHSAIYMFSRAMRKHRVLDVDLDKGVTLLSAIKLFDTDGSSDAEAPWMQGQFVINDATATDKVMASFQVLQNRAGICTDGTNWTSTTYQNNNQWMPVRITGRNKIKGDWRSAEWNLYVNETLMATATGCMQKSQVYSGQSAPDMDWMDEDCVGIGTGYWGRWGVYRYDYVDINTSGDYAPNQWDGLLKQSFSSIAAAKAGGEFKQATITGDAVITKIVGNPQVAYYVQDIGGSKAGIRLNTDVATDVAVGKKVSGITGWLQQQDDVVMNYTDYYYAEGVGDVMGSLINSPGVTVSGDPAVTVQPLAMNQKTMTCGTCVDLFGAGTLNVGSYVSIFGKVSYVEQTQDPFPMGGLILVIDDGTGLPNEQHNVETASPLPYSGLKFLFDFNIDPTAPELIEGDTVAVQGIPGYETYTVGPHTGQLLQVKKIRKIFYPTFTKLN